MSLAGKRYIGLYRCSSASQIETSIPDQRMICERYAEQHGMIRVAEVILDGVTGSLPALRTDLEELIQRKKLLDDFDVVLVHDLSRLTRGGAYHAMSVEAKFMEVGVRIVSATDNLPTDGPLAAMIRTFHYEAALEGARQIGLKSARGGMSSVLAGITPNFKVPPYGCDLLYTSLDGKIKYHIIRNLSDGSQLRLHPETKEILGKYEPNEHGKIRHYRRQPNERITVVPGDPARVEVVRRIYRHYYLDQWGVYRISCALQDDNVASARGNTWPETTVVNIIKNPVYLGMLVANRFSIGLYYKRGKSGPVVSDNDEFSRLTMKSCKAADRPPEEWIEIPAPEMEGYLEPETHRLAMEAYKLIRDGKKPRKPPYAKDRHPMSPFIVKELLRCKDGMVPMTGYSTVKEGGGLARYYRAKGATTSIYRNSVRRRLIPAEPVEAAVKLILVKVLSNVEGIADRVKGMVLKERAERQEDRSKMGKLLEQRKVLTKRLSGALEVISFSDEEEYRKKVEDLKRAIQQVDARIKAAEESEAKDRLDVDEVVRRVVARLGSVRTALPTATDAEWRNVVRTFVKEYVIDTVTREANLTVHLPSWVLDSDGKLDLDLSQINCLDSTISSNHVVETDNLLLAQGTARPVVGRFNQHSWSWVYTAHDLSTGEIVRLRPTADWELCDPPTPPHLLGQKGMKKLPPPLTVLKPPTKPRKLPELPDLPEIPATTPNELSPEDFGDAAVPHIEVHEVAPMAMPQTVEPPPASVPAAA